MKNIDTILHVKGESKYIDDFQEEGLLHAAVFCSPIAHGKIDYLNFAQAKNVEGVFAILCASDIPGENQMGEIVKDEPLFADQQVSYVGQPIALVVAKDSKTAQLAMQKIDIQFQELPAVFTPREAHQQNLLIMPPRTIQSGNINNAWEKCDIVVSGQVETGAQEHLYLETQRAIGYPQEGKNLKVISATQSPMTVQKAIANVLNLPMNQIEVDVPRLGGGFGGKINQSKAWAVMVALAALKLKKPVKLILQRGEDMCMTGKRHPYSTDFKIGLTKEGKILAYEVIYYQNAGAIADSSPVVSAVTLFGLAGSYLIPNVKATTIICKTNLIPNTACRGFGKPEAMFVMEAAIFKAAQEMSVSPSFIQKQNLLQDNDILHYGAKIQTSQALKCWKEAVQRFCLPDIVREITHFNSENFLQKKGYALTPICYGISFDKAFLNQSYALLHIFMDGSVNVTTGAVEMGQGVNMKIRQIVSRIFSINLDKINAKTPNTSRIANTSPTAASFSTDLNGHAVQKACVAILKRLTKMIAEEFDVDEFHVEIKNERVYIEGKETSKDWTSIIHQAYMKRICLAEQAHYKVPNIHWDNDTYKGNPFSYYVFGTAITEVTIDCLRGTYVIDSVKVVQDAGESLNKIIDLGQVEGAIVQGIGWITTEEIIYNEIGELQTDNFTTYKVPTILTAPKDIQVHFLENVNNPAGIFQSKGVGEAPLVYGLGAYFALLNAIMAFRPHTVEQFSAPMTPEKLSAFLSSLQNYGICESDLPL
ncbi:molybdopterin cofactor-binding domain-containing protein [Candidatus Uabimicrobium sp. HlEnr_7]|uniref:molybdopterin cofactor-binding domain-containing protein n=1 Tax=Candidatus Uabimicrobium helgolandensis TaxID=3095367 RepID=UPI003558F4DF